ncbi:MAG: hypothetical protein ACTSXZ_11575 [Alphaproteobacteria bacterium]
MTRHHYPWPALRADYLRAGIGLALTGAPLFAVPDGTVVSVILGALVLLFLALGLRTGLRHASRFESDDEEVRRVAPALLHLPAPPFWPASPFWPARRVAWDGIERLRLRFFSTRRDRTGGWMQLTVGDTGGALNFDSSLDGFESVARRAAAAAARNRLPLNDATRANLAALGIRAEADDPSG